MQRAKLYLLDEFERIVRKENFSDNPRRTEITEEFFEKKEVKKSFTNKNNLYLVLIHGGNTVYLSTILKNISLYENINYKVVDICSSRYDENRIKTLITSYKPKAVLILGEETASKVFNRDIDINKARCKDFKYCNTEGMVVSDFVKSDRNSKLQLWKDLQEFASFQNLELSR